MATDHTYELRRSIVAILKGDAGVSAIVGGRVYPMSPPQSPQWPLIRYGTPQVTPYDPSCYDGSMSAVTLHAFAKTEAQCAALAKAVVAAIYRSNLALDGIGLVSSEWTGTQYLIDADEADSYHAVVSFEIATTAEAA